MTCLRKRKEPVGRLEFPQTATQPTEVIFLIPRYQRKLFVAGSLLNTSSTSCKRLIAVPRRAKLEHSCVVKGSTRLILPRGVVNENWVPWRLFLQNIVVQR